MKKRTEKSIYLKPAIERLQVEMEQGIAAGSAVNPGVDDGGFQPGGSDIKDPNSGTDNGEWWTP